MRTILFLSHSASLTGAPLLLCDIAERLDRSQFTPVFIVPEEGPLLERFRSIGTTIIDPLYPDEMKYWRELKRASARLQLLRRLTPDLVYCNTIHPAKWLLYARILGIPTLTHVHELSLGFAALSPAEHFLIKHFSDRFIAVSDAVKKYLIECRRLPAEKINVVRMGIPVERFQGVHPDAQSKKTLLNLDEHTLVVGTVGRITYMKGTDLLLRIAAQLKKEMPAGTKVKYVIIATTDDAKFVKEFYELLKELRLEEDVIVVENVKNVPAYLAAMDVFVLPSREDPFPLVIMEAMAAGLPIVSFAVGGVPEALGNGAGILINKDDLAGMAEAIKGVLQSSEERNRIGMEAKKRVEKDFTLSRNIGAIEKILTEMV